MTRYQVKYREGAATHNHRAYATPEAAEVCAAALRARGFEAWIVAA